MTRSFCLCCQGLDESVLVQLHQTLNLVHQQHKEHILELRQDLYKFSDVFGKELSSIKLQVAHTYSAIITMNETLQTLQNNKLHEDVMSSMTKVHSSIADMRDAMMDSSPAVVKADVKKEFNNNNASGLVTPPSLDCVAADMRYNYVEDCNWNW